MKHFRQIGVLLVLFAAALVGAFLVTKYAPGSEVDAGIPRGAVSAKEASAFRIAIAKFPEEKLIPVDIFEKFYDTLGPERMLAILDERPYCHSEAHNLGSLMYERTKDMPGSILRCQSKCSVGCAHGVLLGLVAEEREKSGLKGDPRAEDLTPALRTKIAGLCDNPDVTRFTGQGSCYHALGHAYAYFTGNEVLETLKLCKTLSKKGDGAVFHCSIGAYMERSTEYGPVDVKADASRLYPCTVGDFPSACYRYRIPLLFQRKSDPEKIAAFCMTLTQPDRGACFHALGLSDYQLAVVEPEAINRVCGAGTMSDKRMCLDGALGQTIAFGLDINESLCDAYAGMTKSECMKSDVSTFNLRRDYSAYMVTRSTD